MSNRPTDAQIAACALATPALTIAALQALNVNCTNCTDCEGCRDCSNSSLCTGCEDVDNSDNCTNSAFLTNAHYCGSCRGYSHDQKSTRIAYSNGLVNCRRCILCNDLRDTGKDADAAAGTPAQPFVLNVAVKPATFNALWTALGYS